MSKLASLHDLFIEELKDLYNAETQLVKALPKMAKTATCKKLKAGFEKHLEETKVHVTRLEEVMSELDESPKGKTCKAMKGLIEEAQETIEEEAEPYVKDAALIASAQRVEHYEMAGYGTVRTYAKILGHADIVKILQTTLNEEGATDKALTDLAQTINVEAEALAV